MSIEPLPKGWLKLPSSRWPGEVVYMNPQRPSLHLGWRPVSVGPGTVPRVRAYSIGGLTRALDRHAEATEALPAGGKAGGLAAAKKHEVGRPSGRLHRPVDLSPPPCAACGRVQLSALVIVCSQRPDPLPRAAPRCPLGSPVAQVAHLSHEHLAERLLAPHQISLKSRLKASSRAAAMSQAGRPFG